MSDNINTTTLPEEEIFCGRRRELTKLHEMYASGKFEFATFYGRRRIGKTALITEFCKGKKNIFFTGIESSSQDNLILFSESVATLKDAQGSTFSSYENLLTFIGQAAEKERLILVIDEYPYLAESERSISSLLQKHIDHDWKKTKLFLILCGSSMSFMENQVLGYKSPLYGRRTAQFKIQPFSFFEAREMCPSFSLNEQAVVYGLTWGVPEYLKHFDGKKTLDENIINLFFSESGRLFEEPSNLLKQEMRSPASYNAIIFAIAQGASQLNQIATKTGMETGACGNLLLSLMELGIVTKQVPVTEKPNSRKTVYSINDSFFRFWYRFIFPNISYISRGMGRSVYENFVKEQLPHFMGKVFEDICLQYLYTEKATERLPFLPEKIGRWWGTNKKEKQQEEIDIVCLGIDKIIFCEDKWTAKLVDDTLLNDLFRKSALFAEPQKYFLLFSKSGFTKACKARATEIGNVQLVAFKEMI